MVKKSLQVLSIIPARGGSKSIPRKNIKMLNSAPLIFYSIRSAMESKLTNRILVSTDDPEIAQIAKSFGAEVPFLRPKHLSQDNTRDYPVFIHAIDWLDREESYKPDIIVQLRPTSPFRPSGMIDEAISILVSDKKADSVRSVTTSGQNPYKMWKENDGYLTPLIITDVHESYNAPRQELPLTYWHTGHIDAFNAATLIKKKSLTGSNIRSIIIEPEYAIDIDSSRDWDYAEFVMREGVLTNELADGRLSTLAKAKMLVFDFDGVFTNNKVLQGENGLEYVTCDRSDGMGISILKQMNYRMCVLSSEKNTVAKKRCQKLGIDVHINVTDKPEMLNKLANDHGLDLSEIAFMGNDINDLEAMKIVGYSIAVADSHPEILRIADMITKKPGGSGAIREVADLLK